MTLKKQLMFNILAALVVLAIVIGGGLRCTANWTGMHKLSATSEAKAFAQELDLDIEKVTCVKQDTDGDGYVSCMFKFTDGSLVPYECAGAMNLNSGCREPKINVRDGGIR